MKLTKTTTKEHYAKYAKMSENIPTHMAPMHDSSRLEGLFRQDPNLNNIALQQFDNMYHVIREYLPKSEYAGKRYYAPLSYTACVLKHILIYRVLKAEPVFEP